MARIGVACHVMDMCDVIRAFQTQRLPPWVLPLCHVGSKRGWTRTSTAHGCTQADQQLPAGRRRLASGARVRRTAGEVERRAQQRQELHFTATLVMCGQHSALGPFRLAEALLALGAVGIGGYE